jgi:signal transduction histidine kinase/CheY-like chemotaxis protein
MSLGRRVLACFFALVLPLAALAAERGHPAAVAGVMDLPGPVTRPLALQGEWGFAWHDFVAPGWVQLPTRAMAPVPSSWNELAAGGKPHGSDGWGSYVLQVNCPRGTALAVEALGQRTASRLFVNGTQVALHGEPGTASDNTWAAVHTRVPITREFACPLRLTLHVSNFDHRAGGFVRPLRVAPAEVLARDRESGVIYAAALLTAYLLTGLVALIFFAVRRREVAPLAFALFCIAMAVYTDMLGERLLLRGLPPQISWLAYMRIEYLSWVTAMALFFLTLRNLFPAEIDRRVLRAVLATLAVSALAVIVLPPGVYSHLALPGQAIAVLVALYVAVALVRAQRRTRFDAQVLLAGMLAVLASLAMDLLLIDTPGPDRKFAPIGFAFFLLSPAVVIARRLSQALNAEERALTLEENARLREDVERISRHDLKTPLHSILGATRLLRDDHRLTADQRELVGVLHRSGFRMLEMVSLSLGLLKMETGKYDFRPQAVDLREVVTRVLIDLHSHAEAHSVTLHLRGFEHTPVYVRGEELLCYSIIANVVKNAVEAAGAGRQVSLELSPGDPVSLTVHNPGTVPPPVAARFFDKYFTSGKSGGTGLGTYSARLMARAQQGDLQLDTSGAAGTTLTLTLRPLQEDAPLAAPVTLAERPAAHWIGEMPPRDVLVVEDDEYTRLVTRRFLPSPPFNLETAPNGQAGIEAMTRRWPHYLLVDMEMPLVDGLELVRWVRRQEAEHRRRRCQVVMMSGNDDEASAVRALHAGVDRFLLKPVSRELLLSTLRELEQGQAARPELLQDDAFGDDEDSVRLDPPEPAQAGDEVVAVDADWIELFPGFLRSQRDTVEAMARALAAGDRDDVQFLAHRATGGLATMGLRWAARQCRVVEQDALRASQEQLQRCIDDLREHLRKVRFQPA